MPGETEGKKDMKELAIPFRLENEAAFPRYGLPLRCSVPLPEGAVRDPAAELMLADADGNDCAAQWRVLSRWKDGSARFALMDYAEAVLSPKTKLAYALKNRPAGRKPAKPKHAIKVREDESALTIDTGRLAWTFSKERFSFGEAVVFGERDWLAGASSDLCVEDPFGQVYRASQGGYRIFFEEKGPYRVIIRIEGDHQSPAGKFMDYTVRFHFTAGGSQVLMLHHVRNRHGGREGRDVKRVWLEGALDVNETAVRRVLHMAHTVLTMQATVDVPERVDLDVGDYETLIRNGASLRQDPEDTCYSVRQDPPPPGIGSYKACNPLIDLHEPGAGGMLFRFTTPEPNREAPMRLGSEGDRFEIDFFPDTGEPVHFEEGMGKSRDVLFNFHDDSLEAMDLVRESTNLSYPGVVGVPHEVYRTSKFADVHLTLVQQVNKYPLLESKIDMLLAAPHDYEWPAATGWRDWGDEVGARGRRPEFKIPEYINNEEDYLYVRMIDAWRTGKPYGALPMARHLMDIDYIDYSDDPARNGADCPHSVNHTGGEVYPSHQWCQGLLYFYLATGDEEALRIAKRIGDNLCWWVDGPLSRAMTFSGRETAWPLLSLAALYDVTGEEKYRDAGLKVVDGMIATYKRYGQLQWEYPSGTGQWIPAMLTMTFNGIWDMYACTGETRVLELWKNVTAPFVERLTDPDDWGYILFRNWQIKWPDLTLLARWYYLTGDRKYIDLGKNGVRLVLAGCPIPSNRTQGFIAMGYRHFILFLKLADEFGMIDDNYCTLVW